MRAGGAGKRERERWGRCGSGSINPVVFRRRRQQLIDDAAEIGTNVERASEWAAGWQWCPLSSPPVADDVSTLAVELTARPFKSSVYVCVVRHRRLAGGGGGARARISAQIYLENNTAARRLVVLRVLGNEQQANVTMTTR